MTRLTVWMTRKLGVPYFGALTKSYTDLYFMLDPDFGIWLWWGSQPWSLERTSTRCPSCIRVPIMRITRTHDRLPHISKRSTVVILYYSKFIIDQSQLRAQLGTLLNRFSIHFSTVITYLPTTTSFSPCMYTRYPLISSLLLSLSLAYRLTASDRRGVLWEILSRMVK